MKWIQHQNNSRHDPKLRRLIRKHGPAGFGVYWMIVEIIAEKLNDNLDCILEHNLEDLSDELTIDIATLETILNDCVKFQLFTMINNQYQCLKVLKYMDEWTRKKIKSSDKLPSHSGVTPEQLPSHSVLLQREGKGREGREGKEEKEADARVDDPKGKPTSVSQADIDKAQEEFLEIKRKKTPFQPKPLTNVLNSLKKDPEFKINF